MSTLNVSASLEDYLEAIGELIRLHGHAHTKDIAARLNYIAYQEHIEIEPDAVQLLARLADGALRDGLSLLDQCRAAEGTLDSRAVLEVLGLAGSVQTVQLMQRILERDAGGALMQLGELYGGG